MKQAIPLALALVVGCVTGAAVSQAVVKPAHANPSAPRFEYDCREDLHKHEQGFDKAMNAMGAAGWELVDSFEDNRDASSRIIQCFKRPL
jgi:hypothetical protein